MTLPSSGPLLASMINVELGRQPNARFHLNGAQERELAQKPSGEVSFSDFYGKSRGYPTPQDDYPPLVHVEKTVPFPGANVTELVDVTFNKDGTIVVNGTPDLTIPGFWYIGGTPPAGYKILINPIGTVTTGINETNGFNQINYGFWQDMSFGNWPAWVQVWSTISPTVDIDVSVEYDIFISDGTQTVVNFKLVVNLIMTA